MRGVAEVKEPCSLPMLSVDMENKENGSVGVKNSMENGRPPDPADWAVMDVVNYFRMAGFEEQASAFQEQEVNFARKQPLARLRLTRPTAAVLFMRTEDQDPLLCYPLPSPCFRGLQCFTSSDLPGNEPQAVSSHSPHSSLMGRLQATPSPNTGPF
ncbi:sterile alpha motif domain-containing protein 13 isoform X1 [Bos mutus]|uniref:sterile alpha motif domain-containing protein 13 isoform X1 n=1 Tax=Bos mutus TaxID=72004 RepID=UPI001085F27C